MPESDPRLDAGRRTDSTTTSTRTNVPPLAETADPELVKLFIEEAHEELAKIKKFFPAWDQNPMEREALVTVRRSFHTLKGSGRMVGARELGEFAWSIENLLNRVLDNTLTRSPAIVEVLRDSVNALPDMIEQLETGRAPRADSQRDRCARERARRWQATPCARRSVRRVRCSGKDPSYFAAFHQRHSDVLQLQRRADADGGKGQPRRRLWSAGSTDAAVRQLQRRRRAPLSRRA